MKPIKTIADKILGEKRAQTRHRPSWLPSKFDKRILDERFALLTLPPYKPPYRRHICLKAWVDTSVYHRCAILEVDFDERTVDFQTYQ